MKLLLKEISIEDGGCGEKPICKSPKGCDIKKSLKGYCAVYKNENGELYVEQYDKYLDYFQDRREDELANLYFGPDKNICVNESFQDVHRRIEEGLDD